MTDTTKPELAPCPFCGDDMSSFGGMSEDSFCKLHDVDAPVKYAIACDCDATGPTAGTMPKALAVWNQRHSLEVTIHDVDCGVGINVGCTCHGEQAAEQKARIEALESPWQPMTDFSDATLERLARVLSTAQGVDPDRVCCGLGATMPVGWEGPAWEGRIPYIRVLLEDMRGAGMLKNSPPLDPDVRDYEGSGI